MIEVKGDAWHLFHLANMNLKGQETYLCITTNGMVKNNGEAVMGAGIAKEAAQKMPYLPKQLGSLIKKHGNVVQYLGSGLIAFPVKHHWKDTADIELIKQSCLQLNDWIKWMEDEIGMPIKILLPKPGCGNGKLNWAFVKSQIGPLFSDKIIIIDNKE